MFKVRVDYNDSNDISEYCKGSEFYFEYLTDATEFVETCFETNADREVVEIKYIKDE